MQNVYIQDYVKNNTQIKNMNVKVKITKASTEIGKVFNVSEVYYDSLGNEIKQINYAQNSKVSTIITKEYDKTGHPLSVEILDKVSSITKKTIYKNFVNKNGQLLLRHINSSDDIKLIETYIYNKDQSFEIITKEEGEIITVKQYNSKNKLIKLINLKSNTKVVIAYDKNNSIVQQDELRQGKPTKTIIYKNLYDEKNRISTIETTSTIIEYEYDLNDNVVKEIHKNKSGIITLIKYFTYEY